MDRHTITAFFDDRENANNAALRLRRYAILDHDVIISPEAAATGYAEETPAHAKRFWAILDSLFGQTDDDQGYAEGVRRGLVMVIAHCDQNKIDEVASVLERYGSIDLSERETAWHAEGWTGGSPNSGRTVASSDTNLLRSNSAAASTSDEAAAGVLYPPSAIDDYRTSTKPANTTSATPESRKHGLPTGTCATVVTRAEDRGKVRVHRSRIEMSEDMIHHQETGSEPEQSATLSEGSRTSTRPAALTHGTTVHRAKNLEVVGSDGRHVGIIDHVDGTVISLKRGDSASNGEHHVIPTMWVQFIDDKVTLKLTADDAMRRLMAP